MLYDRLIENFLDTMDCILEDGWKLGFFVGSEFTEDEVDVASFLADG